MLRHLFLAGMTAAAFAGISAPASALDDPTRAPYYEAFKGKTVAYLPITMAAVGKPDKYAGELPLLYVQLKSGATASQEELVEFVRTRILERAAVPKSVVIVPEIPLSGPGKISKLLLRRQAIAEVFQEEMDRLAFSNADIRATVEEDRLAGDVVVLSGGSTLDVECRRRVAAALGGFAVQFRWADGGGAAEDEAPARAEELGS